MSAPRFEPGIPRAIPVHNIYYHLLLPPYYMITCTQKVPCGQSRHEMDRIAVPKLLSRSSTGRLARSNIIAPSDILRLYSGGCEFLVHFLLVWNVHELLILTF
jgi:hypothetical protein